MPNQQFSTVALLLVLLAGGLALRIGQEPFGWLQTLAGITLLIILFAFDTENQRNTFQSVAFGAVCGFCLMLVASGFLQHWATQPGSLQVAVPGGWLSVVWVGGALLFFFIDLVRAPGRLPSSKGRVLAPTNQFGMAPIVAAPPVASAVPVAPEAAPELVDVPPSQPEGPPPQPVDTPPVVPQPVAPQAVTPPPPMPAPASGPPPKQALIYVNLLGEGLNMMRAVVTQDLGRGYYLITEPMPEGEQWEFQTGQVVRCEKRRLASGKHLVAVAEAQRA